LTEDPESKIYHNRKGRFSESHEGKIVSIVVDDRLRQLNRPSLLGEYLIKICKTCYYFPSKNM